MQAGLRKILDDITLKPSSTVLVDRFLVLAGEEPSVSIQSMNLLELCRIIQAVDPRKTLHVVYKVYEQVREKPEIAYRRIGLECLHMMISCMKILGKNDQADLLQAEMTKLEHSIESRANMETASKHPTSNEILVDIANEVSESDETPDRLHTQMPQPKIETKMSLNLGEFDHLDMHIDSIEPKSMSDDEIFSIDLALSSGDLRDSTLDKNAVIISEPEHKNPILELDTNPDTSGIEAVINPVTKVSNESKAPSPEMTESHRPSIESRASDPSPVGAYHHLKQDMEHVTHLLEEVVGTMHSKDKNKEKQESNRNHALDVNRTKDPWSRFFDFLQYNFGLERDRWPDPVSFLSNELEEVEIYLPPSTIAHLGRDLQAPQSWYELGVRERWAACLFEYGGMNKVKDLLRVARIHHFLPTFWGHHLDSLISDGCSRLALRLITSLLSEDSDLIWARTCWLRLPRIWDNLSLEEAYWDESHGVQALVDILKIRRLPKISGLTAANDVV